MSPDGDVSLSLFCLLNTITPCLFKVAPMVIAGAYLGNLQAKAAEVKLILLELGLSSLDAVTQFVLVRGDSMMKPIRC